MSDGPTTVAAYYSQYVFWIEIVTALSAPSSTDDSSSL